MDPQRLQMGGYAIAHVTGEAVMGVNFVEPGHHSVARDFGDDRGCGYGEAG